MNIVCPKCGAIDYYTEQSGPHVKAICSFCHSYIKFLPQPVTGETVMYFGKHQGKPLKEIPLSYWVYMIEKNILNGALKSYAQQLIHEAK